MNGKEHCAIIVTHFSEAASRGGEREAYEKIGKGEFAYTGNEELEIQVMSCSLAYTLDSKGYYQPNYRFECLLNGEESEIMIPALKD